MVIDFFIDVNGEEKLHDFSYNIKLLLVLTPPACIVENLTYIWETGTLM